MERLMLQRLSIITNQIEQATDQAIAHVNDFSNIEEAEIIGRKLETAINRFTTELHNYFRRSTEPSADDISTFSEIQLKGEEILCELKVKLEKKRELRIEDNSSETGRSHVMMQSSKLPKLDLAKYDGNILDWHQFWDQFHSNIGCRNLTDVDKLLYLKSSLTGNAKIAIDGLEVTNKNYIIAVNILKERFGKDSQIIDAHYSAIYRIRSSDKTSEDARRTLNEVERHLRVLNALGEDINHNHLRFLIMEKFPEDIVYEMKMKIKSESIEEMRKTLETIISAREDANRIVQDNKIENFTTENLHIKDVNCNQNFKPNINKAKSNQINRNSQHQKWKENNKYERYLGERSNNSNPMKRPHEKPSQNYESGPERKKLRRNCIFCNEPHYNDLCQRVKTLKERKARLNGRCFGCFSRSHMLRECKAKLFCIHCQQKGSHNRALCPKNDSIVKESTKSFHVKSTSSTVLQTAVVKAKGTGNSGDIKCRVLLDSGSQRSYVTQDLAKRLNLPVQEECRLSVFTFASNKPQEFDSKIVKLQVQTRTNDIETVFANVVPTISEGIAYPKEALNKWKDKAILADDGSLLSRIDILIGNDYYFTLISTGKIKLNENLYLIESKFGWILSGKLPDTIPSDDLSAITYFQSAESKLIQPDLPLNNGNIKDLWELESIGIYDSPKANRDEEALQHFNDTTKLVDDRYVVSWPWNEYPPNLSVNFGLAFGRLINLLKRLNTENVNSYNETLQEQLKQGIIEVIPEEDTRVNNHPVHYLPHHGVCQPGKPTRIVYDASAKTKENKSLNECLHCGPMMLENLTGIFLRFRSHQIGIVADVEKAFLQLALHDKDKDVTRFLWLKDITRPASEDNLLHLRFRRVPFGVISSPFLLNATIRHHLSHHCDESLKQMANDIYVDNLVTGAKSNQEAITTYKKVKKTFQDISMNMRAWSSNSRELMNKITKDDACNDDEIKVLGLNWHVQDDTIQLRGEISTNANTKREVLKVIASIFDPCGYAAAHLLPAKLYLQELWKRKELKWDTRLPSDLATKWSEIAKELEEIKTITLPRCYLKNDDLSDVQLHCFVDASMKAYSAVVYMTNRREVAFVIGKSRLVPIKDQDKLKIPRLELLGALIGSRLVKYVTESLHIKFKQQILWTDSQIVIDWYNSSKLLTPFVARRIDEIRKNTNLTIRKVPTQLNSADIATRPNHTKEDKQIWLSGPKFLLNDSKSWPSNCSSDISFLCGEDISKEVGKPVSENDNNDGTTHQQIITLPMRPVGESLGQDNLSTVELQKIKEIQNYFFPEETNRKETDLSRNLGLFLDENGLIRCKGRMKNADWPFDNKYPILIPKNCDFTDNVIIRIHEDNYHIGVNHTLSLIREKYWIPQGRSYVQRILKKCRRCIKQEGGPFKLPPTPALPRERVNYSTPYTFCGLDYFGPLYIKTDTKEEKRWVCLYTCLAVRSITLEVVKDLTAHECLLALRRFISSRGVPAVIVSDNALQFKLSAEVLSDNYCIKNKITWKFIAQLSPWHGGFYERLVGIVKNCLRRTFTKQLLSESHLITIMKEIEAVVNTRPLTCVGSEVEGVLRPADFLTLGKCITTESSDQFPDKVSSLTKQNLIESWKRGQSRLNEFKDMFTNQYLPSLRERFQHSYKQSRVTSSKEPKIGNIVQLKGESKNRENWRVGKIISLPLGADGLCRVARVRVGDTEFTRSLAHLYPLEVEDDMPAVKLSLQTERNQIKFNSSIPVIQTKSNEQPSEIPTTESDMNAPTADVDMISPEREASPEAELCPETKSSSKLETHQSNTPIEVTEVNPNDSCNEKRGSRVASQQAREKIREWTRQLTSLF